MDKGEFFSWCERRGLHARSDIAAAFSVSGQTVSNWSKRGRTPSWIDLACDGYDALMREGGRLNAPMTVDEFEDWRLRNDLRTNEEVAAEIGYSRQAVHNWFRRGRFPRWLRLVSRGVDARREKTALDKTMAA